MVTQDITWKTLIKDAESQIEDCREKIKKLSKSIVFFKKQDDIGVPFPTSGKNDSQKYKETS